MNRIKREHLKLILTPSLLSAGVGLFVSLGLLIGAVVVSLGSAGRLQNDLFAVKYVSTSFNDRYHSISQNLGSNHFINQLGLWLFWAAVGLIAYFFTISLFRVTTNLVYFRKSLKYAHAKPHQIIVESFSHLGVRLTSLIIGGVVLHYCFKNVLPYCLAVIRDVSEHWTVRGDLKLIGVLLTLMLIWHLLTMILRLLFLKPRIFGYSI